MSIMRGNFSFDPYGQEFQDDEPMTDWDYKFCWMLIIGCIAFYGIALTIFCLVTR